MNDRPTMEQMSDALMARVIAVRNAAVRTVATFTACSICGPLDTRSVGVAVHTVSNPGHIVTHAQTTTTVYQDKGRPFHATERTT